MALKITAVNNTNGQQETQAYARITNFLVQKTKYKYKWKSMQLRKPVKRVGLASNSKPIM